MDKKIVGLCVFFLIIGCIFGYGISQISEPTDSISNTNNGPSTGLAIANSGSECLNSSNTSNSGWIHTVAHGNSYSITFDISVEHNSSEDISITREKTGINEYALNITTENQPVSNTSTRSKENCDLVTRLSGGGEIPTTYEEVTVTYNGEEIIQINNTGTTPELRKVPNPIVD